MRICYSILDMRGELIMKRHILKVISILLSFTICFSMIGCSSKKAEVSNSKKTEAENTSSDDKSKNPIVIRVNSAIKSSTIQDTANGLGVLQMVDNFNKKTNGGYEIKLFMDSQLGGSSEQVVGGLQSGAFEMCTLALGSFGEYTDAFMPMNLPYLFSSAEVLHKVLDGEVGQRMKDKCIQDTGIRVLAFTELGFRHLTNSKRPIKSPSDVKGLKIRTMNDPYQISAMEALGAAVTPTAYSELFTALQQGLVDGQENPCQNIWTEKFYEVQKYMTLTKHTYTIQMIGISEKYFQSLSKEVQDILIEEGRNAELLNRSKLEEIDNSQLEELKKVMEVYELTPDEFNQFKVAASKSWTDAKNAMGEEYFNLLTSEVEKYE